MNLQRVSSTVMASVRFKRCLKHAETTTNMRPPYTLDIHCSDPEVEQLYRHGWIVSYRVRGCSQTRQRLKCISTHHSTSWRQPMNCKSAVLTILTILLIYWRLIVGGRLEFFKQAMGMISSQEHVCWNGLCHCITSLLNIWVQRNVTVSVYILTGSKFCTRTQMENIFENLTAVRRQNAQIWNMLFGYV